MMDTQLPVLRDPRLVAGTVAVLFQLFDDLPSEQYGTFRDPGAAVMLSVIFGNSLALAVKRRWDRTGVCFLMVASILKLCMQGLFYVHNARIIDSAFLLLTHFLIGVAVPSGGRPIRAAIQGVTGAIAVAISLMLLNQAESYGERSQSFAVIFFTYAAARALIPLLFWSSVLPLGPIFNKWSSARHSRGRSTHDA